MKMNRINCKKLPYRPLSYFNNKSAQKKEDNLVQKNNEKQTEKSNSNNVEKYTIQEKNSQPNLEHLHSNKIKTNYINCRNMPYQPLPYSNGQKTLRNKPDNLMQENNNQQFKEDKLDEVESQKKSDKSISEIDSEPTLEPSLESASEADLELTASEFTSQPDVEPTLELGSEQLIYNERKEKDEVIASTSCDDLNEADSNDIIVEQTTDFKQNVSDEHNRKQEKYQPNLENNQNSNADNKISIPKWLRPFIIQDNNIDTNYQDDIDIMMNGNAEEVNEMSLNADMDTTLDNEKVENANDFSLNNVEEDNILEEADQSSLGDIQSDDTLNKKSFQNQQNTNHNMNKHTNHIDPLEGLKRICLIHQNLKKQ